MLTNEEAAELLAYASSYDSRKPNPRAVASWVDASVRGRWDFDDAVEAIGTHYTRTTEWVMPGHVTEAVRARRNAPPPPDQLPQRQLAGPGPADPQHIAAVIDGLARELGWEREINHRVALAVQCPWCQASPGEQCTRPSKKTATGTTPAKPHPGRIDRAAEQQMEQEARQ